MKLGFIGAGNMAGAIIKGFINKNCVNSSDIYFIRQNKEKQAQQAKELGINGCDDYNSLIENSNILFLGVKPVVFPTLLPQIAKSVKKKNPLVVSMAAGLTTDSIREMLGYDAKIIRIMPNVNAAIAMSTTAVCKNKFASDEDLATIKNLFSTIGLTTEVPENQFAIFTAIAGCSPAYVYMFIDGLARGAQKMGMNKQKALEIAASAVIGSASMYAQSNEHPQELVDKVCSPGGTTIESVTTLEEYKFTASVVKAVENSILKDRELSKK